MIVGIKSGCYTLFHGGHFWMLEQCAKQCHYLIALTNDDDYVMKKKRFIAIPAEERLLILQHHDCVNEAHMFHGDTEHEWIKNFVENRLEQQFGRDAILRVFHSEELKDQEWVPGQGYAHDITFVPKQSSPYQTSVTEMCKRIRGDSSE